MSIALFATPGLWAPLQGFLRRFTSDTAPRARSSLAQAGRNHAVAVTSIAANSYSSRTQTQKQTKPGIRRPLRIVRILEAGQAPSHVGRMVISGRMADVCAELDRLAARESEADRAAQSLPVTQHRRTSRHNAGYEHCDFG